MHRDSTGGSSTLRPGEVQVMTAGTRISYSEWRRLAVLTAYSAGRIWPSIVGMSSETVGWMGTACSSTS